MLTELTPSHDTLEDRKNVLVKDLKIVVNDATELLKEVPKTTSEEFAAARTKIEAKLIDARTRLDHARGQVVDKALDAASAANTYVKENPWKVLGVAAAGLAIGVIGVLVRRNGTQLRRAGR